MKIIRKYFWFMPAAIWMYVIFSFSDQVGETSAVLSLKVTEKVVEILMKLRIGPNDYYYLIEVLHPLVRKGAHMAEYAILFLLLFLSFLATTLATRSMAISIIVSFVYACADEFHQTFVDSRAGQFTDVCVDMTGVLAMVTVLLIIYSGWQVHHEKKLEKERRKAEEIRNSRRRTA